MIIESEEFENVHINTGGKKLTEAEAEEVKEFMKSDEFKEMIEKAEASSRRVKESKITDRTKY